MSDSECCRATAARYARLAERAFDTDAKRDYFELESLWLETASWTDRLHLNDFESARRRIYELIDSTGTHLREVSLRLN